MARLAAAGRPEPHRAAAWLPALALVGVGRSAGCSVCGRHLARTPCRFGPDAPGGGHHPHRQAAARGIAFPIFYAVFAIPFGDEFVPPMQTLTAELTMGLLNLTGVPALLEGVFITTRPAISRSPRPVRA
jgi:hypothetical protein